MLVSSWNHPVLVTMVKHLQSIKHTKLQRLQKPAVSVFPTEHAYISDAWEGLWSEIVACLSAVNFREKKQTRFLQLWDNMYIRFSAYLTSAGASFAGTITNLATTGTGNWIFKCSWPRFFFFLIKIHVMFLETQSSVRKQILKGWSFNPAPLHAGAGPLSPN